MQLPRFVVFGEALTDFVRTAPDRWHSAAGGSGWNVARVAATLGLPTGWAGAVSADLFGDDIVARSRAAGLDMRFVQVVERPPLIAMVHRSDPPRYFFLGEGTADLAFDEKALPQGWEEVCEVAHFGCISLIREPLGARLVDLAERLHARGTRISFDPNYRNLMDASYPALFEHMAGLSHIIKLSEEDLSQIYPDKAPAAAMEQVCAIAPQALVLYTQGERGMSLIGAGQRLRQPAFSVAVSDTVGAGDASVGGLVASLLGHGTAALPEHLRFAAATAAAACTAHGAHAPTRAEVEGLLAGSPL